MERLIEKCFGLPEGSVYSYEATLDAEGRAGFFIGGDIYAARGRIGQRLLFRVASLKPLPDLWNLQGINVVSVQERGRGLWEITATLLHSSPLQIHAVLNNQTNKP